MSRVRDVGTVTESYRPTLAGIHWKIPDFLTLAEDFEKDNLTFVRSEVTSSGCNWVIFLDPKGIFGGKLWISLYCEDTTNAPKKRTVTCYVGSQKAEFRESAAFERQASDAQTHRNYWLFTAAPDLDYLKRRKSKLASSGDLTITFYVGDNHQDPPRAESRRMMGLVNLSSSFEDLFVHRKKTDVTVKVEDKDFPVHKIVLMARSPVFSAMFDHDTSEEQTGVVTVPDCDPDSFESFLYHLYTGKFDRVTPTNAHHLYVTSEKYDVQVLKLFCVDHMIQNLTVENVLDVAVLADRFAEFELLSSAQDFFNRNASKVTPTPHWRTLMEEDLELANQLLRKMEEETEIEQAKKRRIGI